MLEFDQLCRGLDVDVSGFSVCELRNDTAFGLMEDTHTSMHYVLAGQGIAYRPDGSTVPLEPHTVIIAPVGTKLTLTADPANRHVFADPSCVSIQGQWDLMTFGEGGPGLMLACGVINARYSQVAELFEFLSDPLVEDVRNDHSFREPFQNLLMELSDPKPGAKVLAEMFMKQCLIALLRIKLEASKDCELPWLAALGDPCLGRALHAMLEHPERNHTVESLGDIAGMSRTSFSEHFRSTFGRTAIDCLKEIRLRRAANLLLTTDLPVKAISAQIGFESRSYFSRAFKDFFGVDPAGYRRNAVEDPQIAQNKIEQSVEFALMKSPLL